ncbi:MAG: GlpM family protein [Alphaproteobacteria bacterium]|nr:GlpM family protein [Alphaproteobacteria bacterium]
MSLAELALRFVVSGALVVAVTLLGRTGNNALAGAAVLFPAVTLIGFYFLGRDVGAENLKAIALNSLLIVPAVLSFLIATYFALGTFSTEVSLLIGVGTWLATAAVLIGVGSYFSL